MITTKTNKQTNRQRNKKAKKQTTLTDFAANKRVYV